MVVNEGETEEMKDEKRTENRDVYIRPIESNLEIIHLNRKYYWNRREWKRADIVRHWSYSERSGERIGRIREKCGKSVG